MAARLLSSGERIVVLSARSLRSLCAGRRTFSSEGSKNPKEAKDVKEVAAESLDSWLDIRAGIFGPSDQRLPLPGNVGLSHRLAGPSNSPKPLQSPPAKPRLEPDILTCKTNHELQLEVANSITEGAEADLEDTDNEELGAYDDEDLIPYSDSEDHIQPDMLECKVQECPDLVKKDFRDLFPGLNLREEPLTVVTLSQRTKHDMSCWSQNMERERRVLQLHFLLAAKEICVTLAREGYWADFIDPTSGRPYLGRFTNDTLFETDERYRHMGFRIEDQGCCKIISHRQWGTKVFVGAIFTNAPIDSEVLDEALRHHESQH